MQKYCYHCNKLSLKQTSFPFPMTSTFHARGTTTFMLRLWLLGVSSSNRWSCEKNRVGIQTEKVWETKLYFRVQPSKLRNTMVSRCMLMCLMMAALSAPWVLEQPASSLMEYHPAFQFLASRFKIYKAT